MEITKEKIYELGKEKIVTDLVNEILSNDPLDIFRVVLMPAPSLL